jgi:hypothetical protein
MHVACKCVLKQLPADSMEAQQQWPYALALAAGEAVAYAKQHLDRCVASEAAADDDAASGCTPALLCVGWLAALPARHDTSTMST